MSTTPDIDTFYLLDLDRTLFDTPAMTQRILAFVAEYDAAVAEQLAKTAEEDFQRGYPFAIREEIEARLGEARTDEVENALLQTITADAVLLEGARESIAFVDATPRKGFGILTFGEPKGQLMKLQAAGFQQLPYLITAQRAKGALVSSWRQADGVYRLPQEYGGVTARAIVLVDDRLISFQGLPEDARGYWIVQQPPTTSEVSVLPAQVTIVRSLHDFIDAERQIDRA